MIALRIALRNVLRRKLTLVLIVVPAAVLFAMVTFLFATQSAVRELLRPGITQRSFRMGSLDAVKSKEDQYFSEADVATLAHVDHVTPAPASFFPCGTERDNMPDRCGFTNAAYVEMWDANIHVPPEELARWDATKDGALVTSTAAAIHGWHVGDHITLYSRGLIATNEALDLVVTYIADKFNDPRQIFFHSDYWIQRFRATHPPSYWVVWGLVDKPENRDAAMAAWDEKMSIVRPHLMSTMEQTKQALLNGSRVLRESFEAAGYLSALLVIFLSVALTTLSVEQRTTEMAALRAVGFRRGTLAASVLIEGMTTLPLAAFLGAMALWVPLHDKPFEFEALFHVNIRLTEVWLTVACGAAIGLLASAVPAWRVYKLDVLQALR